MGRTKLEHENYRIRARQPLVVGLILAALIGSLLAPTAIAAQTTVSRNEVLITSVWDGSFPLSRQGIPVPDTDPVDDGVWSGTAPEAHTPGLDNSVNNGVVRTNDLFQVRIDWNINEADATNVFLEVVLPPFVSWETGDYSTFAGCDPATSTLPDPQTLRCSLLDQSEGSNGVIRPTGLVSHTPLDGTTFDVVATLTTADNTAGVFDGLDQPYTVSEVASASWVTEAPVITGPVNDGAGDGYVFLYPLTLRNESLLSEPDKGTGLLDDTVAITLNDHAWSLVSTATVASAAQLTAAGLTGRNACGNYDGTGAFPVTVETWVCGTATSPNGYPVVPITVSGQTTSVLPATNADGTTNDLAVVVSGQIAFWLPKADVDVEIADVTNGGADTGAEFFNTISSDADTVAITSQADATPIQVSSTTGLVDESSAITSLSDPNDNTRRAVVGAVLPPSDGGGSTPFAFHDIEFLPAPVALVDQWRRFTMPLRHYDFFGQGRLPGNDPSRTPTIEAIGEVARGQTVAIRLTAYHALGRLTDLHGCAAFDTEHYSLTSLPPSITVREGTSPKNGGVWSFVPTGAHTVAPNAGPLAYVDARSGGGAEEGPASHFFISSDFTTPDLPFVLEYTDAPILRHSGSSFGAGFDGVTCNDADAGPSGWVDASTGDLSVFDTVNPGDDVFEGITRVRMSVPDGPTDGFSLATAYFHAKVKTDLNAQTNDQELHAMASHALGEFDALGVPDFRPYPGSATTYDCEAFNDAQWIANGNDLATATGWCNGRFHDDGTSSTDTGDLVERDAASWTLSIDEVDHDSHDMVRIVGAQLGVEKTNLDGLNDVADNGDLVQFEIAPSVTGSPAEALTNVRLVDDLNGTFYEFVRFVSQPATGPGCTETSGVIECQFSEPDPLVNSDASLSAGLPGGWSDSFIIEVVVKDAVAAEQFATVLTNTVTVDSDQLGPWDQLLGGNAFAAGDGSGGFTSPPVDDAQTDSDTASSFMPSPADEAAILKAVDTLEGPCVRHPLVNPMPADWPGRCSMISMDDDMSFTLSLDNHGNTAFTDIEIVDVFPHNTDATEPASNTPNQGGSTPNTIGDGRYPPTSVAGTLGFVSMTPLNVPAGSTVTTWVSGDPSLSISRDPDVSVSGATPSTWCDTVGGTVQLGTGSCPATATDVTATYTHVDGSLLPGQQLDLRLTLDSEGDVCTDVWTNTFGARVDQIWLPIRSNDVSIMVDCEFDLALEKTVDSAWTPPVSWLTPGTSLVPFVVEVTNQGDGIEDFDVTDYVDTNVFAFDPANNAAGSTTGTIALPYTWDVTNPATPFAKVDGALPAGAVVQIPVNLTVIDPTAGPLENLAEISRFDSDGDPSNGDSDPTNPGGGALLDKDSMPDGVNDEPEAGVLEDGETGESDTDTSGDGVIDEDDHDIAYVIPHSLGNQIWEDIDNNGMIDSGENSIPNVWVELFADTNGDGLPDDLNNNGIIDASDAIATTGTDSSGMYLFDGLAPGDYVVGIPPMEWDPGQPLENMVSSTPTSSTPNDDVDSDDNGTPGSDRYIFSGPVTLGDAEPTGATPDNDPDTDDTNENLTIDFGFYTPNFDLALRKELATGQSTAVALGDLVTFTITVLNQGNVDATNVQVVDYLPSGMTLQDPDWTTDANGNIVTTLPGVIAAGSSATVDVTAKIVSANNLENHAEIAASEAVDVNGTTLLLPNGTPLSDIDSTADTNNTDTLIDNEIGNTNGDEDDHDIAAVTITAAIPPNIAFTGRTSSDPAAIAALLLLTGLAFTTIARRKRYKTV